MNFREFFQQINSYLQNSPGVTYQIVGTIVVLIILWIIRIVSIRIINRNIDDTALRYKWRKNLTYIAVFLGLLIIGRIWFEGLQSVATFLGLVSAGLAIALRDPVTDLAGWIFIMWRKPLKVGDRVEIGNIKGDVIDTRVFKFTVLEIGNWVQADQSTGRVVHVPNHKIFTESLANYTSDFEFIWNEIEVLVTFESDWKKAKEILQRTADKHLKDFVESAERQIRKATKSYLIHYRYLTPIVYTNVKDSGVNLTIRHITNPRSRRSLSQAIWEEILDEFQKAPDIELAYPTMRIYRQEP